MDVSTMRVFRRPQSRCPSFLLPHCSFRNGGRQSLVCCSFDSVRLTLVTSDNLALRMYSYVPWRLGLKDELTLPAGTTTECLLFHKAHDVFFAIRDRLHIQVLFPTLSPGQTSLRTLHETKKAHPRAILTMAVCEANELLFTGGVGGFVTTWRLHRFPDDKRKGAYHISRLGRLDQRDGRWVHKLYSARVDVHRPAAYRYLFAVVDKDVVVWHFDQALKFDLYCHLRDLHDFPITDVAYDPSSKRLVTSSLDRCVKVWTFSQHSLKRTDLMPHSRPVRALVMIKDQQLLCSICEGGVLKLWSLSRGGEWDAMQVWAGTGVLADTDVIGAPPKEANCQMVLIENMKHIPSGSGVCIMAGKHVATVQLQRCCSFLSELAGSIQSMRLVHLPRNVRGNDEDGRDESNTPGSATVFSDTVAELLVLTRDGTFQFLDPTFGHVHNVISPAAVVTHHDADGEVVIKDSELVAMLPEPSMDRLYTGWTGSNVVVFNLTTGSMGETFTKRAEIQDCSVTCMEYIPATPAPLNAHPKAAEPQRSSSLRRDGSLRRVSWAQNSAQGAPEGRSGRGTAASATDGEESRPTEAPLEAESGLRLNGGSSTEPSAHPPHHPCLVVGFSCGSFLVYALEPGGAQDGAGARTQVREGELSKPSLVRAHSEAVLFLHYLPASHLLVSASSRPSIKVWKKHTGNEVQCIAMLNTSGLNALSCLVASGSCGLVSGHQDGIIAAWNLQKLLKTKRFRFAGLNSSVKGSITQPPSAPNPYTHIENTRMLGSKARSGNCWDEIEHMVEDSLVGPQYQLGVDTNIKPAISVYEHKEKVLSMCVSSQQEHLASCSKDQRVIIWKVADLSVVKIVQFRHEVSHLVPINQNFDLVVAVGRNLCVLKSALDSTSKADDPGTHRMQPDLLQLLQEEEDADGSAKSQTSLNSPLCIAPHKPTPPSFPPPLEYQMDNTGAVHLIRLGSQSARDFTTGLDTSLDAEDGGRQGSERGSSGGSRLQAPKPLRACPSKLTTSARRVFMRPHTAQMTNTHKQIESIKRLAGLIKSESEHGDQGPLRNVDANRSSDILWPQPPRARPKTGRSLSDSGSHRPTTQTPSMSHRNVIASKTLDQRRLSTHAEEFDSREVHGNQKPSHAIVPKLRLDEMRSAVAFKSAPSRPVTTSRLRHGDGPVDIMTKAFIIPHDGMSMIKSLCSDGGRPDMHITHASRLWTGVAQALSHNGKIVTPSAPILPQPGSNKKGRHSTVRRQKYNKSMLKRWEVQLSLRELPSARSMSSTQDIV